MVAPRLDPLFPNFALRQVDVDGTSVNFVVGGSGTPVLMLHGYPQTHAMWHKVAPRLAQTHTVVCADLRGYGDSAKPDGGRDHVNYSKRAMAKDQVGVMRSLGLDRFAVVGHDRGGRVAHRMALDHPDRVTRLMLLDISPTRTMYAKTDQAFATAYYHWFFLIQPFDLPERLIGHDPVYYLRRKIGGWSSGLQHFDPASLAEYERCFSDPATIHASCEDYRAAVSIDLQHDAEDADTCIRCPVRVLWGEKGVVNRLFDPIADWSAVARSVSGRPLPCGHYLAEEAPAELIEELEDFLV